MGEKLLGLNSLVNSFVWGPIMLVAMWGISVFFTAGTGGVQLRHFATAMKKTVGSLFTGKGTQAAGGRMSPFQAVSTALAGTMGTGNIAGVATAIVAGGPGAIFWMWVSALFGMATKYAEVLLAVRFRTVNEAGETCGGPMYYIGEGLGWKKLAALFSILCVLASFGIGNMSQSNSIAQGLETSFGFPAFFTGVIAAILVGLVIIGGVQRIGKVAESVIPLVSIVYILVAVGVIFCNRTEILPAFATIFTSAFNMRAAAGGFAGYGLLRAMRFGVARGVFSNEAGLGSAPIAHACANTDSAVEQGFWGIFEVFADTLVCCTLTTLVILTADGGALWMGGLDGAALTTAAFASVFGDAAGGFVSISMVFFALASMLGWYLYGERSLAYLTGTRGIGVKIYRALFLGLIVVGAVMNLGLVWDISDTLNGLMAIPNLIGIVALSPVVFDMTDRYFSSRKHRRLKK